MGREADEALVVAALHARRRRLPDLEPPGPAEVGGRPRAARGTGAQAPRGRGASRREAEERHRALIEEIPALTYIAWADPFGSPVYVSPQIRAMTGFSPGSGWRTPRSGRADPPRRPRARARRATGERAPAASRSLRVPGARRARDTCLVARRGPASSGRRRPRPLPARLRADVTDRKQAEETHPAPEHHDALTGLPNRTLLHERLRAGARGAPSASGGRSALLLPRPRPLPGDQQHAGPPERRPGHPAGGAPAGRRAGRP